ncbi:MAG: DUF481 domain-containing protein [Elusimicrobia bacterium]|nr:DUF481 domain-containing protein [Elusimicrobiota bacterium]
MIRRSRCLFAVASALFAFALGPAPSRAQNYARTDDLRTRPPELWFPWQEYGLDLRAGGGYLQGNVRSNSFSGGAEFTAKLARDHQVFLEAAEDYARFGDNIVLDKTKGSVLYAYSVQPRWNLFALSTQARNRFLQVRYRTMNGGGVCYHSFLPGFDHILASYAVTPDYEAFNSGLIRQTVRSQARLNFAFPVSPFAKVGADFIYMPSFSEFANYVIYSETYLQLKVTKDRLSFKIAFIDEYDSRPFAGIQKNDRTLNYSLLMHFGR